MRSLKKRKATRPDRTRLCFTGGAQTGKCSTLTGGIFLTLKSSLAFHLVFAVDMVQSLEEDYNELHSNSLRQSNFFVLFCTEQHTSARGLGHASKHMTACFASAI